MRVALLVYLFSFHLLAARLDPIIVTSKTNSNSSNLTPSHEVLGGSKLEDKMTSNVIESLKSIPGVFINQTGGPGAQASIYLRGSEVRHVLVLIDGVKVNDPSNPDKQFNAANLSSLDIEKIEVIKGAQSVLYGSDAIGGVINIITKKGEPHQRVGLELGFQTGVDGSISIVGQRSVSYINFLAAQSDGISAKKNGDEKDGYLKKNFTLNHSQSFKNFEAHWLVKILEDFVEDDRYDTSFNFVDDPKAFSKSNQKILKQKLKFEKEVGIINHSISHNQTKRQVNLFVSSASDYKEVSYEGATLINDLNIMKKLSLAELVVGVTHEYETFSKSNIDSRKFNLYSAYGSVNHRIQEYFFNLGLRADHHETFGSVLNYNLGLGKKLENRKQIKINHATGFKAPTIYQLYVPQDGALNVGNEDLAPEKSKTIDITYSKMGWNNYQVTFFNSYIYNYINFTAGGYDNLGSFNSSGVEISLGQKNETFEFRQGVTLADFSVSSGQNVYRRPEQKVDFSASYNISDYTLVNLEWRWVGNRLDITAAQEEVSLRAYDLLNLSVKYKEKDADYQLGVNNIFDREYYDVFDYSTLGMTVFGKVNYFY